MRSLNSIIAVALALAAPAAAQEAQALRGDLQPVNAFEKPVEGEVMLSRENGRLTLSLTATGAPPGPRLAHIHGFATVDPEAAHCPGPEADADGDGYIDLIETREAAGVTMIPFTENPTSLELLSKTYPRTGEDGRLTYEQTVDAEALAAAVEKTFGSPLALDRRVVFVHGAPESVDLPETVRSLEGVPARVTIPIACADLAPAS